MSRKIGIFRSLLIALLVAPFIVSGCDQKPAGMEGERRDRPWTDIISVNEFDDSKQITLIKTAVRKPQGQSRTPALVIKCESGQAYAFVAWEKYLGTTSDIEVRWRAGKNPAVTESWANSNDNQTTFVADVAQLIGQLLSSEKFLIEITPYRSKKIQIEIELTNFNEVFESSGFIEACPLES